MCEFDWNNSQDNLFWTNLKKDREKLKNNDPDTIERLEGYNLLIEASWDDIITLAGQDLSGDAYRFAYAHSTQMLSDFPLNATYEFFDNNPHNYTFPQAYTSSPPSPTSFTRRDITKEEILENMDLLLATQPGDFTYPSPSIVTFNSTVPTLFDSFPFIENAHAVTLPNLRMNGVGMYGGFSGSIQIARFKVGSGVTIDLDFMKNYDHPNDLIWPPMLQVNSSRPVPIANVNIGFDLNREIGISGHFDGGSDLPCSDQPYISVEIGISTGSVGMSFEFYPAWKPNSNYVFPTPSNWGSNLTGVAKVVSFLSGGLTSPIILTLSDLTSIPTQDIVNSHGKDLPSEKEATAGKSEKTGGQPHPQLQNVFNLKPKITSCFTASVFHKKEMISAYTLTGFDASTVKWDLEIGSSSTFYQWVSGEGFTWDDFRFGSGLIGGITATSFTGNYWLGILTTLAPFADKIYASYLCSQSMLNGFAFPGIYNVNPVCVAAQNNLSLKDSRGGSLVTMSDVVSGISTNVDTLLKKIKNNEPLTDKEKILRNALKKITTGSTNVYDRNRNKIQL